jgi:hypothetical protein
VDEEEDEDEYGIVETSGSWTTARKSEGKGKEGSVADEVDESEDDECADKVYGEKETGGNS